VKPLLALMRELPVKGIAHGCELAGCALIGGETAEMPGMYAEGEYDLAGFAVGVVEKSKIVDGRTIAPGDAVLGLASSGPHSNGYSLIRRIVDDAAADLDAPLGEGTLADALMAPTRIYVKPLLALMRELPVKGMAHVTGGGITENVPRMLPAGTQAKLDASRWPRPAVFDWLAKHGRVDRAEMLRVFNCGIGMAVVVAAEDEARALARLAAEGERAWRIGTIVPRPDGAPAAVVA
jgi:phosphoribosylformylglycinamidine cyclo-ligase